MRRAKKCICEESRSVINTGDSPPGFSGSITCPLEMMHDELILAVHVRHPSLVLGGVYATRALGFFGNIINNVVSSDL